MKKGITNTGTSIKNYQDLEFTDNFMFCKILYNNERLCRELIELLLDVEVDHIEYKSAEYAIKETSDSRGIRLDVYVRDDKGTVFDLEMQNATEPALAKRSRYYQSMIDIDHLPSGGNFDNLPDSYVVFICMFDAFKKGLHKYEFRELCLQDKDIELGSGTSKVYINAKSKEKDMSEDMRAFLDFLCGEEARSNMTKDIAKSIEEAKSYKPWEAEYIGYYLEMAREREAGREEGREEGKSDILMMNNYLIEQERYEDLERATKDEEFRESILKEMSKVL